MKSTINFYYNLFPDEIINQKEFYYFFIDEFKYYFVPFNNDEAMVKKIYEELDGLKIKVNNIIFNKDNNITTLFDNKPYALMRVNCLENVVVDLCDFMYVPIAYPASDWGEIWSRKIDYYAYQISERGLKKSVVLNSFSYYVGLSENAISYFNLIKKNNAITAVQHRRLYSLNYEINYYNPLNMVFDYSVRDVAEFIKFSFFDDKLNINRIMNYINKLYVNDTMINLLYARLLFPTYYFDLYDKIVNDELGEGELIKIISKVEAYEEFLKNFYLYFFKKYNMLRIEWLLKT